MFETLRCCPAYYRCYSSPLCRHQLGKVKQLLLLLSAPFSFLNTRIKPLKPAIRQKQCDIIFVCSYVQPTDSALDNFRRLGYLGTPHRPKLSYYMVRLSLQNNEQLNDEKFSKMSLLVAYHIYGLIRDSSSSFFTVTQFTTDSINTHLPSGFTLFC